MSTSGGSFYNEKTSFHGLTDDNGLLNSAIHILCCGYTVLKDIANNMESYEKKNILLSSYEE